MSILRSATGASRLMMSSSRPWLRVIILARAGWWRDLNLVEFVLGVPPAQSFDPELDRPLAREAMRAPLPHQSRPRAGKAYFDTLVRDAVTGVDASAVRALLTGPRR